jgi:hypothetical protein
MASKVSGRRLAIGVAGALLASMVITGIAPVAADSDTRERDYLTSQEVKDLANDTRFAITSVAVPANADVVEVAAPTAPTPYEYDDRR